MRLLRIRSSVGIALLGLLALAPGCGSGGGDGARRPIEVLDQESQPPTLSADWPVAGEYQVAQTFTVGVAGRLTAVELLTSRGSGASAVVVEIRPTVGGLPDPDDNSVLATAILPQALMPADPEMVRFEFPWGLPVDAGDSLAFVVRGLGSASTVVWGGGPGGGYPAGDVYLRDPGTGGTFALWEWVVDGQPGDIPFRTYVKP